MSKAVMRQALELLERYRKETPLGHQPHMIADVADKTITALRAALAEPEPVCAHGVKKIKCGFCQQIGKGFAPTPQPEQEPVDIEAIYETIIRWDMNGGKRSRRELARRIVALYTAPTPRKPLTREEVNHIWDTEKAFPDIYAIARAIEAAHGIKEQEHE